LEKTRNYNNNLDRTMTLEENHKRAKEIVSRWPAWKREVSLVALKQVKRAVDAPIKLGPFIVTPKINI